MSDLLRLFMEKGHFNLLFLTHIENIEIHIQQANSEPKLLFKVCVTHGCLSEVQRQRKIVSHKCNIIQDLISELCDGLGNHQSLGQ